MKPEIERCLLTKEELIAVQEHYLSTSHDVHDPMTVIQGYTVKAQAEKAYQAGRRDLVRELLKIGGFPADERLSRIIGILLKELDET